MTIQQLLYSVLEVEIVRLDVYIANIGSLKLKMGRQNLLKHIDPPYTMVKTE